MIKEGYKTNLKTLIRAAKNDDLALVECTDKKTSEPVIVICAMLQDDEFIQMIPIAKMFDGNPYDEVNPPTGNEIEFHPIDEVAH